MNLLFALLLVGAVNLPFGYWRAGLERLSLAWFVAIHAPVPLVFLIRHLFALEWQLGSLPLFLGAFFLGQWLGGRVRLMLAARAGGSRPG